MEPLGVFPDGEWDTISRLFSTDQDQLEFTPHFFAQGSFNPFQHTEGFNFETPSTFCPNPETDESLFHPLDTNLNSNMQHYLPPQESSCYGSHGSSSAGIFAAIMNQENYYFSESNDVSASMDACMMPHGEKNFGSFIPAFTDIVMEAAACNNEDSGSDKLELKRVHYDVPELLAGAEEKSNNNVTSENNPKKKPRLAKYVQKSKKNEKSKKGQKANSNVKVKDEEESNTGVDRQSSSSYNSSEDDNASQETNGGENSDPKASSALNLSGKTRANRGSATDPQSLYARKRRERINERLRILQNLVPNGTKVDISTMLEEAVHYVKFLQLQIKILSSDDMWMYAPIAYNGMDLLNLQKISPLL